MSRRRAQSGQALALGVAMIFLLALFMYLIASFGHHVQQKIEVQTTADATALSLATMEAESMNYIAFANRAQAAQYVMAMNVQAYISWMSWVQATASAARIIVPIYPAANAAHKLAKQVVDEADNYLPKLMDTVDDANQALWVTEIASSVVVATHLSLGGHEFFRTIANTVDPTWANSATALELNLPLSAYNVYRWEQVFSTSGGRPLDWSHGLPNGTDRDTLSAQRVMAEVSNATRADSFLIARGPLPTGGDINKVLSYFGALKNGASKLITNGNADEVFGTAQDASDLATGSVMASEDTWFLDVPLIKKLIKGSVWAKIGGTSQHCREPLGACENEVTDKNHKYKGISPYMTYQATANDAPSFHQPDVFVWLFKEGEQATMPGALNFTMDGRAFDTRVGTTPNLMSFAPGVHAIARAQAYYHRPGNWQEPPNLFNPFWRARLAPVAAGVAAAAHDPGAGSALNAISSVIQPLIEQNLITH